MAYRYNNDNDEELSSDEDDYASIVRRHRVESNKIIISSRPTEKQLQATANRVLDHISEVNNHGNTASDKHYDTVAVGYGANGKLYVAGNVKERFEDGRYGTLGITNDHVEPIRNGIRNTVNQNGEYTTQIVRQRNQPNEPQTIYTNARDHAEMQVIRHAQDDGTTITRMGISKPACVNCEAELDRNNIRYQQDGQGNKRPKNWANPNDVNTEKFNTQPRDSVITKIHSLLEHNMPSGQAEAQSQIKQNLRQQVIPKPNCQVSAASVLDAIDDFDKGPASHAGMFNAYSGTYKKPRTGRVGAYANASFSEASASKGVFGASASALSASAHVEVGTNNSVGVNLSLVRAEAHAGPIQIGTGLNFNTGASVGLDGIQASALGFGVSIGPRMSVRTPVADVSVGCCAM